MISETLAAKLDALPVRSGCYLFKDAQGRILYIGKATSLRARVRSYFQAGTSDTRAMLPFLLRSIDDVETILTASEKEATILEDSLIKKHKPKYNVRLRDDKSYLCLRIDTSHPYPRLQLVRRPTPDGARYFGPHHSSTAARRTMHFVNKHFQLRTCSDSVLKSRKRPCLQYHIRRCPAPCVIAVDAAVYQHNVRSVILFLEGQHDEVSAQVRQRMSEASSRMEYELAAVYRDQLRAIEAVRETQRVVTVSNLDQDVIGLHRDAELCELSVLFVRRGRMVDTVSFGMRQVGVPDEEVIGAFISHYYGQDGAAGNAIPDEVLVPVLPESATGVRDWLSERRGRKVALLHPKRGPRAKLVALACDNATHAFGQKRMSDNDLHERLLDIQRRLRLLSPPRVIECVDISHLGGTDTAAGLVRMVDGVLDPSGYRAYHVKLAQPGDDYGAMYEVLARRFHRALQGPSVGKKAENKQETNVRTVAEEPNGWDASDSVEQGDAGEAQEAAEQAPVSVDELLRVAAADGEMSVLAKNDTEHKTEQSTSSTYDGRGWETPDLLVVDGGRGQLNIAMAAARDLGMHGLAMVGLAEERQDAAGQVQLDRVFLPGQKNGIPIKPHTSLVLLARLRDEAHRFANESRKKRGNTHRLHSELDNIPGIGPVTRKRLLTNIGGPAQIRDATDQQLRDLGGANAKQIQALREYYAAKDGTK